MAGRKNKPMPPAPVSEGKKNPPKDSGAASVNPVEEEPESSGSGGSDTDALSHLPTDEESGAEDKGAGEINEDTEDK